MYDLQNVSPGVGLKESWESMKLESGGRPVSGQKPFIHSFIHCFFNAFINLFIQQIFLTLTKLQVPCRALRRTVVRRKDIAGPLPSVCH